MYTVEENSNYCKGEGNLFLLNDATGSVIGGAELELVGRNSGKWVADVDDGERPGFVKLIGFYETQAEARQALLDYAKTYNL